MVITIDKFSFNTNFDALEVLATVPGTTESSDPWRQVYIKRITIGTQNAYNIETGDGFTFDDDPIERTENGYLRKDYSYGWVFEAPDTFEDIAIYKTINVTDLLLDDNKKVSDLFFIKIETAGNYLADAPCSTTGDTWSSIYDSFSIDAKGMEYIKELASDCTTPTGFTDYILNKNAIDVAAGCGDYATMISRYNELMGYSNVTTVGSVSNNYKKCGCNGY